MSIDGRRFSAALLSRPLVLGLALAAMVLGEAGLVRPAALFGPHLPRRIAGSILPPSTAGLPSYPATLSWVVDGDTFDARVALEGGRPIPVRIRLLRIDAPEMKARCAREWRGALAAKRMLLQILREGELRVTPTGPDKYGRMLADVSTRRTADVSTAMLQSGLARPYDGGHRDGWCD
ncbi:MAG TPA: thermonuclease family protein [Pseudolabrys sp.]|nr:thermonuclease family protein [Pseudolabrys sp.]